MASVCVCVFVTQLANLHDYDHMNRPNLFSTRFSDTHIGYVMI